MKGFKSAILLCLSIFVVICSVNISQGFNPQPEPPVTDQVQPADDSMRPPGSETLEATPESLTETDAGKIQIKPRMSQPYTVTQPLSLQGESELQPQDAEVSPGEPKMTEPIDQKKQDSDAAQTPGAKKRKELKQYKRKQPSQMQPMR